jgi:hypothetical protein
MPVSDRAGVRRSHQPKGRSEPCSLFCSSSSSCCCSSAAAGAIAAGVDAACNDASARGRAVKPLGRGCQSPGGTTRTGPGEHLDRPVLGAIGGGGPTASRRNAGVGGWRLDADDATGERRLACARIPPRSRGPRRGRASATRRLGVRLELSGLNAPACTESKQHACKRVEFVPRGLVATISTARRLVVRRTASVRSPEPMREIHRSCALEALDAGRRNAFLVDAHDTATTRMLMAPLPSRGSERVARSSTAVVTALPRRGAVQDPARSLCEPT